jgi:hypothetical protein
MSDKLLDDYLVNFIECDISSNNISEDDIVHAFMAMRKCKAKALKKYWSVLFMYTTRDGFYVECQMLCRVPFIGHSVKSLFVECRTRQTMTLGKAMHSAKKESSSWQRFTLSKDTLL